jgi:hypothetical protein
MATTTERPGTDRPTGKGIDLDQIRTDRNVRELAPG